MSDTSFESQHNSDYYKANEEESIASRERRQTESHQARGESTIKWWILGEVFVAWTSAYFLTFCVSPLESTLLEILNWSSSQYSYIVAATFVGAIIGPLLIPFFERHRGTLNVCSIHHNQLLLIVGQ